MGSGGNRFAEKLSYKLEILVLSDVKDCFASKVSYRCGKQSVPPAVAGGSPFRISSVAYRPSTHPLPRVVLTVFKHSA
jgi:hypothetical protein